MRKVSGGWSRRWATILAVAVHAAAIPVPSVLAEGGHSIEECADVVSTGQEPWLEKMPDPQETTVTKEDVQVESRDGTQLAARVYLPDANKGSRLPTILVISPYNAFGWYVQEAEDHGLGMYAYCDLAFFLRRGYAAVLADARGTRNSGGCWDLGGKSDREDGRALVDWIADRAWSNGNVGMYGISAYGMTQYAAAAAAPRALKAIIPVAPVTSWYRQMFYGGLTYDWTRLSAFWEAQVTRTPPTNVTEETYPQSLGRTSCMSEFNERRGTDPAMTEYFKERNLTRLADRIEAAVFHVQGTLDQVVTTDHFSTMWDALERANVVRKALVGPWAHVFPPEGIVKDWPFMMLRWYEHWLNDNDTGMMNEPRLTLMDQEGRTRTAQVWPSRRKAVTLEASGGGLSASAKPGMSTFTTPPEMPRAMTWTAPTMHTAYTTDVLRESFRLSGTPILELVASLDTTDADFVVHLFHIDGDGERTWLTHGYLDAVHRRTVDEQDPVPIGEQVRYRIHLYPREFTFERGSRIELLITGADNCYGGQTPDCYGIVSDQNLATVTVHEGSGLTRIRLPIAP